MAKPKKPENFYVIKRNNYAILKWDRVTKDINDEDVTVKKYIVYRTQKTNSNDFIVLGEVTTTDFENKVDTIFIDIDIEENEIYFYKVSCVNIFDEESEATQEEAGIYFGDLQDNKPEKAETIAGRWDISVWDGCIYS